MLPCTKSLVVEVAHPVRNAPIRISVTAFIQMTNASGQRPRANGFPIATVASSRGSLQSDSSATESSYHTLLKSHASHKLKKVATGAPTNGNKLKTKPPTAKV